jgi:hypothetical protein
MRADDTGARVLEGDERQAGTGDRFGERDRWQQRRSGDAGTLRELEEKERERGDYQHRGRYGGLRRRPWYPPALDRKSGVEAIAKVG